MKTKTTTPKKHDGDSDLREIKGVELICEDFPYSKAKPYKTTIEKSLSGSPVGWKLFGFGKAVSDMHAIFTFDRTNLHITDSGSKSGTWLSSKGALLPQKACPVKDGDTVVFGAKEDKMDKTLDVIRVKLKILRLEPKPLKPILKVTAPSTTDGKLDVPKNPAPRSVTPNTLKPPGDPKKHRRTVSLELPPKDPPPFTAQKPAATTNLQLKIKIPWSDPALRAGFGVDALTGESMASTALTPLASLKMSGSPRPKQAKIFADTLHWDGVKSLQDQYGVDIGGTINIAPAAVAISTQISSLLSKNMSTRTVLIQYRVEGEFESEFIPASVRLQDGLGHLSENEFREKYGDYYLAGRIRGYGCRMVIVCQVDSKTVTNELEIEAKTLVENFFKAGVKHSKTKSRSKNCSILHVMIESYGCTTDASYLSNGLLSATDALAALPKILKKPQGTSRFGILYHYSSLVNWNLPQTVVIPQEVFYKIQEMRDIYLDLQTDLEHPALQSEAYFADRARARLAMISFEQKRKNLVRNWKLERKPKRLQDTELYSQMAEAKLKTNRLMRRYEFIARIKAMKREWTRFSNPGITKDTREFVWECGKVQGGKILKKLDNYTRLTFGAGFEAYEVEWQSPLTTSPNAFKKMIGQPKSTMNFIQIDRPVDGKKRRIKEEDEKKDGGFFDFRLVDAKVYVIGWKISCVWEGKPEPGPLIQLDDGEPNFILSDRFSVTLDTSYPARWRCKVLFVFQLSYNFPDLKLDQRNPEPDLDELYSVRD